jgi:alpha-tubulin suppressor-like RCC1 family protein
MLLLGVACSEPARPPVETVASLTITAGSDVLYDGETDQVTVVARDAKGEPVQVPSVTWGSSDTAVAIVSGGVVNARGAGTAVLVARVESVADSFTLTVLPQPTALTIDTQPRVLAVDDTVALGIAVLDSSGNALPSPRILITTSDSSVAYITRDGRLITSGGGQALLTLLAYPHGRTLRVKVVEFVQISAGDAHTCAVTTIADVYCWGVNLGWQLGDSSTVARNVPTPVKYQPTPFARVAAGGEHSCALNTSAGTYCWGWGGTGSDEVQPTPTPRPAPAFSLISAGRYLSCGLTTAGEAQCWGHHFWNGAPELLTSPTAIPSAVSFVHIDVGRDHACGLDDTGVAACWGTNTDQQLGMSGASSDSALIVPTADRFVDVAAGWRHTCGVTAAGELKCWGVWPYSGDPPPVYRTVASPEALVSVSTEAEYTCARSVSGKAYCMGRRYGMGDLFYPVPSMRPVLGDLKFEAVEAGEHHGCGLTASGAVYCWGFDYVGTGETWLVPTKLRPTA